MIISEIKRDKKHLTRLIVDNEEIFLDNDTVSDYNLKCDIYIDDDLFKEIIFNSDYKRAKSRALWYLDRTDYTEKSMYQKLVSKGFNKEATSKVIARFVEVGLIDDRRFAENLADRLNRSNVSKRETISKLIAKGVSYDLAKEITDEFDEDESEQINAVIEKKYLSKLSSENGTQKVYSALIRKGFSFSAVREALKKYSEELEFSEE